MTLLSKKKVGTQHPDQVIILDGSGDQITSFGGGTQYTEGDIDATLTGTVAIAEGPSNTATPLQVDASKHLQVDIAADSVGIGGGTEYTEGDTDASIAGKAILMEGAANTLLPVQGTVADGLLVNLGSNNDVTVAGVSTAAKQDTIIGHVDGIEGLLTTIDADTGNISAAVHEKDSAVMAADKGIPSLARLRYTASHSTGGDGDYDTMDLTSWHELRTRDQRARDIQNCNDATDFTALNNDTINVADSLNHVFGTGAVTFDKTNGAANTVFGAITTTVSALDISDIFEDGAFVGMSMYLPSLTNVSYAFIRLGTDSSNYNEWRWTSTDLSAASWMTLRKPTASPSAYLGNGWDSTAITYLCVGVAMSAESNTLTGIVVDHIHFVGGRVTDTTIDASITSSVTTPNVNIHRVGGSPTDTNSGSASSGTIRTISASDSPDVTSLALLDDAVFTDDTSTHSTGTTKVIGIGAVADPTDAAVNANDIGMPAMNTNRALKTILQANSGVDIGDVDVTSVSGNVTVIQGTATNLKVQAENYQGGSAVAAGNPLQVTLANGSVPSHAVTNAGTFAVQDSEKVVDNAGFTDGTTKVLPAGYIYDEVAGTALTENDAAAARINVNRAQVHTIEDGVTRGRYATVTASNALKVDASGVAVPVTDNSSSLSVDWNGTQPVTGSGNATGALRVEVANNGTGLITTNPATAANWGIYVEDAGETAGGNLMMAGSVRRDTAASSSGNTGDNSTINTSAEGALWATLAPTTTSGLSVANFNSGDTYTALTNSAQVIKGSAGNFYGYYYYNPNATAAYIMVYDVAAASVTVGTTTAKMVYAVPPSQAANVTFPYPISFGTAMSCAAATTGGGNTAPSTALEVMIYYK